MGAPGDTLCRRPHRRLVPRALTGDRMKRTIPQPRHHRPRRPRQDDAGRRAAVPERHVPRQRARGRARDGQHRPRARARHHDPGQEHRRPLRRRADQHRRHARATPTSAARSSGRSSMVDGVLLLVDASEGPLPQTRFVLRKALERRLAADRRHQQDRPAGRPDPGGAQRGLRPVHRSRRHRGAARLPRALHQRPRRHGEPRPRRRRATDLAPAVRRRSSTTCRRRAGDADGAAADARGEPRLRATTSAASPSGASSTAASSSATRWPSCKLDGAPAADAASPSCTRSTGSKRIDDRGRPRPATSSALAGIEDITIGETVTDAEHPHAAAADRRSTSRRCRWSSASTRRRWPGRDGPVRHLAPAPGAPRTRSCSATCRSGVEDTDSPGADSRSSAAASCSSSILIEMMRREGYELQVSRPEIVTREIDGVRRWSRSRIWSSTCPRSSSGRGDRRRSAAARAR
ncbi:MAG: hypothetical protein MZU91_04925 [Desulfosudis oleivorans]|nr:hypothetical protein [Desulfosudis oleivorans]